MFIDSLGNLSVLRTFRVLRALKTVAIVPGIKISHFKCTRINILKLINSQLRAENNCRFSITISFTSKRRYYFNFFHTKRVCIVGPSTLYGRIEEKMRLEWTK